MTYKLKFEGMIKKTDRKKHQQDVIMQILGFLGQGNLGGASHKLSQGRGNVEKKVEGKKSWGQIILLQLYCTNTVGMNADKSKVKTGLVSVFHILGGEIAFKILKFT